MLGKIIFESKGKIIGQRVKSVEYGIPKLEITATVSGTVRRNFKVNETGLIGLSERKMVFFMVKAKV
jgi:hypothetical protein